jgi:hypothetical protein
MLFLVYQHISSFYWLLIVATRQQKKNCRGVTHKLLEGSMIICQGAKIAFT